MLNISLSSLNKLDKSRNYFVNLGIESRLMRQLVLISFLALIVYACVKKPSTSPIPTLAFKDARYLKVNGSDSGYLVLSYEDGDGDIFRDKGHTVPNLIITNYYKDTATGKFAIDSIFTGPGLPRVASYATTVYQPGDGYKGKSVRGDIIVPYDEFRSGSWIKTFYHTAFIVDEAGNKSNLAYSQTVTLNF